MLYWFVLGLDGFYLFSEGFLIVLLENIGFPGEKIGFLSPWLPKHWFSVGKHWFLKPLAPKTLVFLGKTLVFEASGSKNNSFPYTWRLLAALLALLAAPLAGPGRPPSPPAWQPGRLGEGGGG